MVTHSLVTSSYVLLQGGGWKAEDSLPQVQKEGRRFTVCCEVQGPPGMDNLWQRGRPGSFQLCVVGKYTKLHPRVVFQVMLESCLGSPEVQGLAVCVCASGRLFFLRGGRDNNGATCC